MSVNLETLLLLAGLIMAIALSLSITFLIARFAAVKEIPWLEDARRILAEIKERIEEEDLPLEIEDIGVLMGLLKGKVVSISKVKIEEIQEAAKELNILFMIMRREISQVLKDMNISGIEVKTEDEDRSALSIGQFIRKCEEDNHSREEILKVSSEKGNEFFILRDEEIKRLCMELRERNSVTRFLEAKKEFLSLIEKIGSRLYG